MTDAEIARIERLIRDMQTATAYALAQAGIASLGTALGSVGRAGQNIGAERISGDAYNVGRGGLNSKPQLGNGGRGASGHG